MGAGVSVDLPITGAQDTGQAGTDTLTGFENVIGSHADDHITGDSGDNVIEGLGSSYMADYLSGGAGSDTASFAHAEDGVTVDLNSQGVMQDTDGAGMVLLDEFENLLGSAYGDTLTGDANDNVIEGGGGGDELDGGGGTDTVSFEHHGQGVTANLDDGGAGDGNGDLATLFNFENILGSAYADQLTGDEGDNVIEGLAGDDTLEGGGDYGTCTDTVSYEHSGSGVTVNIGDAILNEWQEVVFQGHMALDGFSGVDTLYNFLNVTGSQYADTIYGNAEDNVINGLAGDDTLFGGDGIDTVSYASAEDEGVSVSLASGLATGNQGDDTLTGFENVTGSDFDDEITGNDGDNLILGGLGDDDLDGGDGTDTVSYLGTPPDEGGYGVTVDLSITGAQDIGEAGWDTLSDFENLIGTVLADDLTGDGGDNVIDGRGGGDTLSGGSGHGSHGDTVSYEHLNPGVYLESHDFGVFLNDSNTPYEVAGMDPYTVAAHTVAYGGSGGFGGTTGTITDTISNFQNYIGTHYVDYILGNAGDNVIEGLGGGDELHGGGGTDTVSYEHLGAGVTVDLSGQDSDPYQGYAAYGGPDADILTGFTNVIGSAFGDSIIGDDGDNVIEGGASTDTLNGGLGIDTVSYEHAGAADAVDLGNGTAEGGAGSDSLVTVQTGQSSFENILGSAHGDTLSGDVQANVIDGGAGDDTLSGGWGISGIVDTLIGGDGSDTLRLSSEADLTVDLSGQNPSTPVEIADDWNLAFSEFENIRSGLGDDLLTGDGNDNVIEAGGGTDTLHGGGNGDYGDTISFEHAELSVNFNLANQAQQMVTGDEDIITQDGFENILGSGFGDTLLGSVGNNVIDGGDGNDVISGGDANEGEAGSDILHGGDGTDTISFAYSFGQIGFDLSEHDAQEVNEMEDTVTQDGFENIIGGAYNDTLYGSLGDNLIMGGDSGDSIEGRGGNDTLDGGDGNDFLSGGLGNDSILGGNGNDTINGKGGCDTLDGGANTASGDTLSFVQAGLGVSLDLADQSEQTINANSDTITQSGFEHLIGSRYNDLLYGTTDANLISGGEGNDFISGMGGNDTLSGYWGTDTVSYMDAAVGVSVDLSVTGVQTIAAGWQNTLDGFENIIGSADDDILTGNSDDNVMDGKTGTDELHGGGGTDTLTFRHLGSDVSFDLAVLTQQMVTEDEDMVTQDGFENIIGSDHNDELYGDAEDNVIQGMAGNDTLYGGHSADDHGGYGDTVSYANTMLGVVVDLGNDIAAVDGNGGTDTLYFFQNVLGSDYNDMLYGDDGDNVITGGTGDDLINGKGGIDALHGGDGTDTLSFAGYGAGVTVDLSDSGIQVINALEDTVTQDGFEIIQGSAHADSLTGDAGDNILYGNGGQDSLFGAAGDDMFMAEFNPADLYTVSIDGGDDADTLNLVPFGAVQGLYTFTADLGAGKGYVYDNSGADPEVVKTYNLSNMENLFGSSHNDTLTGNASANIITGGNGLDTINGGAGADTLTGGQGNDWFVFTTPDHGSALKTVTDFASDGNDTLGFDVLGGFQDMVDFAHLEETWEFFSTNSMANNAYGLGHSYEGNALVIYESDTQMLYYDADGNGTAHDAVALAKVQGDAVTSNDIHVVNTGWG